MFNENIVAFVFGGFKSKLDVELRHEGGGLLPEPELKTILTVFFFALSLLIYIPSPVINMQTLKS